MEKHQEIIQYSVYSIKAFCSDIYLKCVGTLIYVFYSFAFDALHTKMFLAILALIIADFVTGLLGAKLSGEEIKSAKIFRSAIKCLIYFLFISSAKLTESTLPSVLAYADETIIAFLAITEFISIIENIGKMGFVIPKKMLNKLKKLRDDN